jgi:hypothetical protein
MDIKLIKKIVTSNLPDKIKESQIIELLANDEDTIPMILKILEQERKLKTELVQDLNLELSRAHIYIEIQPENKEEEKERFNKKFVIGEISNFYAKYKGIISHCFNRFN